MKDFKEYLEKNQEIGYIDSLSFGIAKVSGLPNAKVGEMVITESNKIGIVHGIKRNFVEALILDPLNLKVGERVTRTGEKFKIKVGKELLGRIINPLCQAVDNLGPIEGREYYEIERKAPPFIERVRINKPLETGVMIVDLLVPIGYGQRELVIGDAKTGKTTFLLQAISSQAKKGVVTIYVGIGKKDTDIRKIEEYLKSQGILKRTIIIHASPDDPPPLVYLAPFSGMAIAEYFRDKGNNVLIIFDDLSTHAKTYREISLLMKRTPGRESYPGDIFHVHARLLERAGNVKDKDGKEISITALPVAETLENNLSGYIQTNLIAITDGHIFFDSKEFKKGKRPAINTFLSVSRVGNQTKSPIEKHLADWLRKRLLEYQRSLEISQFGAELPPETKEKLNLGEKIGVLFHQDPEKIISRELQLILMGLLVSGFWKEKSLERMREEISKIYEAYQKNRLPKIPEKIEKIKDIDHLRFLLKDIMNSLEKII